jgi:hypothetical protein
VINNTLGLPFEEPEETYSTSAHLYHDLGIDPGAKGRIAPPKPARSDEESQQRRLRRPEPTRTRNRRRLRNGVPVERDDGDVQPAEDQAETPVEALAATTDDAAPADPDRRRRRRG